MPRTFVEDGAGRQWAVDTDAMYALVRANISAVEIRRRTTEVLPRSWRLGPSVYNTQTDWTGYRATLDEQSQQWWTDTRKRLSLLSGERVVQDLVLLRAETAARTQEVLDLQAAAQHKTMRNIELSVGRGEVAYEAAKLVRDASAMTFVVIGSGGAGFLAGGALTSGQAFAVLAGGSVLKGGCTFQDSGSVGNAVLEASSTLVVGALSLAGGAGDAAGVVKEGGRWALVTLQSVVDGGMEAGKAIADGKSGKVAIERAALRVGIDLTAALLESAGVSFDKLGINVDVAIAVGADRAVGAIDPKPSGPPVHRQLTMLHEATPLTRGFSFAAGTPKLSDEQYVRQKVLTQISS